MMYLFALSNCTLFQVEGAEPQDATVVQNGLANLLIVFYFLVNQGLRVKLYLYCLGFRNVKFGEYLKNANGVTLKV